MHLGLVTYNWGKDWDLPTILKNLQVAGWGGVELRSTHKHGVEITLDKAARKEVAKQFADSGIVLVGTGSACEYHSPDPAIVKKNIEETKAFIELTHDCGGTGVKVRPNGLPKEVPVQKTLEQIGRALNEVAEFGEGYGIQIRVEVHGAGTQELPHMKTIMDVADNPNAKVCWNCNEADMNGAGLEANFAMVAKRIGTVHIHDLISTYPWQKIFDLLKGSGFNGWTLVEEGAATTDPIRVMKYYRLLWERMTA
jgi:sugar phosphate isomerase/epimerase